MRYLELTSDFPPAPLFGAGIHVADLVKGLADNGDSAVVATRKPDRPSVELLHGGRVEVINGAVQHPGDISGDRKSLLEPRNFMADRIAFNHTIVDLLNERAAGFDVVHNHDPVMFPAACEIAETAGAPLITTVHVPDVSIERSGVTTTRWLDAHTMRALEIEGYRRSAQILVPSQSTGQLLADAYPWCADRLTVLELPLGDNPRVKHDYESHDPVRILTVNRLDPFKGLEHLVAALGQMPAGSVECVVVGAGGMRGKLAALAQEKGVRLDFRGKLPHDEVLDLYHQADFLVAPSPLETYGLVVQEAMSVGLPVIAADIPVIAERISDGVNGLLVPSTADGSGFDAQVSALASAIERLSSSVKLRRDLGRAARQRVPRTAEQYAVELGRLVRAASSSG